MNRVFYLLYILSSITISSFMNNDASAQSLAGRYGGVQDGFCLFDNGRFFLYGYATLVPGTYHVEKDHIRFVPDKPANTFMVFARENKDLHDSVRMYFNGFERGKTFLQLNNDKTRSVFNEDANCFSPPYVYEDATVPSQIAFSHMGSNYEITKTDHNTEIYTPGKKYNDFVFLYQKPNRYQEPFVGVVTKEEGETVLRTSLTGSRGLLHEPNDKEVEEMRAYLGEGKEKKEDVLYANRFYKLLMEIDTAEYTYNAATGQYTAHGTSPDGPVTDYNDISILHKYVLLTPASKENRKLEKTTLPPVFYTACGDPEKSYRYKPLDKPATPPEGPIPTTTVPVQIK